MTDPTSTASAANSFDARVLFDQARAYLAFGEQMAEIVQQAQANLHNAPADWGDVLRQNFAQFKEAVTQSIDNSDANPEFARLWRQTLELWQQTSTSLGVVMPTGEITGTGPWLAYQQVQDQYLDLLRQVAAKALDLLERQLLEQAEAGKTVASVRELYNLWVDCNEKTYGQMLRGAEYAELSGRLFNSLLGCYPKKEA